EVNSTINMKQVSDRKLSRNVLTLSLIFILTLSTSIFAQDGDTEKGKTLFNTNCAACHALDKKITGPALRNIEQVQADDQGLDREWLAAWIRNSSAVIKSGDAYAKKIFDEFGGAAMTPFPQLSDEDINDILAYTAQEKTAAAPAAGATTGAVASTSDSGISNKVILGALALLFALLAM